MALKAMTTQSVISVKEAAKANPEGTFSFRQGTDSAKHLMFSFGNIRGIVSNSCKADIVSRGISALKDLDLAMTEYLDEETKATVVIPTIQKPAGTEVLSVKASDLLA